MPVVELRDIPDLMALHREVEKAWRDLEECCDALSFLPNSVALRAPDPMMTGPELACVYANRARRRLARALCKKELHEAQLEDAEVEAKVECDDESS